MPRIMPIKELKNTKRISEICEEEQAPIFITSNGFNKLVVMSDDVYNKYFALIELYQTLSKAEEDIQVNKVCSAKDVFKELDEKYEF